MALRGLESPLGKGLKRAGSSPFAVFDLPPRRFMAISSVSWGVAADSSRSSSPRSQSVLKISLAGSTCFDRYRFGGGKL